jgi:hypothetical protein
MVVAFVGGERTGLSAGKFSLALSDEGLGLSRGVVGGEKIHGGSVGTIFVEAMFCAIED